MEEAAGQSGLSPLKSRRGSPRSAFHTSTALMRDGGAYRSFKPFGRGVKPRFQARDACAVEIDAILVLSDVRRKFAGLASRPGTDTADGCFKRRSCSGSRAGCMN